MIDVRAKTQRVEGKIASDHAALMSCHTSMAFQIKKNEAKKMNVPQHEEQRGTPSLFLAEKLFA